MKTKTLINDPERLKDTLGRIPQEPGCYIMIDNNDNILYVGKSKLLRNRVRSYFRLSEEVTPRIRLMVKQIINIEFIVTDTESEALTLESNLIKNHQPYFNILLKDDKKYPYLCITWSEKYPRVFITRRRRNRNKLDRYYGPFVDVGRLRNILFLTKRLFPLRQRPIPLYKDRTCLNFSIGRCPGVCQEKISSKEYQTTLKKVSMIFQGRSDELTILLKKQMERYSRKLEYEKAALIRDQINGIEQVQEDQKMILPDSSISRDVIALSCDKRVAAIQIFQMRSGKLVGRLGYNTSTDELNEGELLQHTIELHYGQVENVEIPNEIHVQFQLPKQPIISEWLSELKGKKVAILCPKRNMKFNFIEMVQKNAEYELQRIKDGQQKQELALEDLASLLELDSIPHRIEGYDISHIQGSDAVASQVVFINGIPAKQHYRKYKIKNKDIKTGHSDDFISLVEVIQRRFSKWERIKKETSNIDKLKSSKASTLERNVFNDWPDLVMIDGGKGQLSAVMAVLEKMDLANDLVVCSLAKKNEDIYLPNTTNPIDCEHDQIGVILLRRLRDEAHRFALSFHRKQRTNRMTRSQLSDIAGIGPSRIKELLNHFRSVEAIQMASLDELTKTPGLGNAMAKQVWNYFHPS